MLARVWNTLMILLIGPFADAPWRCPADTARHVGAA